MALTALMSLIVALAPLIVAVLQAIGNHNARERKARNALVKVEVDELTRGMDAVDKLQPRPDVLPSAPGIR